LKHTRGRPTGSENSRRPPGRDDPLELGHGAPGSGGIERIAVAAEADVLGDVQAAHRGSERSS
jgi:hypothetical protein